MKKFAPILLIVIVIAVVVVLFLSIENRDRVVIKHSGNIEQKPIKIIPNKMQDPYCLMKLESSIDAVEVISPSGNTWFFDDIGCAVLWLEDKSFKDRAKIYIFSTDTKEWIDAKKAYYKMGIKTPMLHGFGAYKDKIGGYMDYQQMSIKILQGETMADPKIRKRVLGL
jgi:hypothetical protein